MPFCAWVCVVPAITPLTKPCTSSWVMRPFGPLPFTSSSGTPSSRASLRIVGDAWGNVPVGAVGSWAGSAAVGDVRPAVAAAADAGGGVAGAGAAADAATGAPPAASTTATTEPLETLSPTFTATDLTTPAWEDGISIEALSLSTVIRLCSTLIVSPALTITSITATSSKSPMSGTTTSTVPPPAAGAAAGAATGAGAGDAAAAAGAATGAGAGAAAPPSASSTTSSAPSLILSPSLTFSSLTTPACDDGISIDALSDSTVTRLCSAATLSPGLTSSSMISTSLKSPMSGTFTSTNAMTCLRSCSQA